MEARCGCCCCCKSDAFLAVASGCVGCFCCCCCCVCCFSLPSMVAADAFSAPAAPGLPAVQTKFVGKYPAGVAASFTMVALVMELASCTKKVESCSVRSCFNKASSVRPWAFRKLAITSAVGRLPTCSGREKYFTMTFFLPPGTLKILCHSFNRCSLSIPLSMYAFMAAVRWKQSALLSFATAQKCSTSPFIRKGVSLKAAFKAALWSASSSLVRARRTLGISSYMTFSMDASISSAFFTVP
mmetsp:Transcript_11745/g.25856  ORF Transcript_11745/g.25856 Transcript_11745/m.25856 type:complete len:242 (+) Transcript_11745:566-1291(+)